MASCAREALHAELFAHLEAENVSRLLMTRLRSELDGGRGYKPGQESDLLRMYSRLAGASAETEGALACDDGIRERKERRSSDARTTLLSRQCAHLRGELDDCRLTSHAEVEEARRLAQDALGALRDHESNGISLAAELSRLGVDAVRRERREAELYKELLAARCELSEARQQAPGDVGGLGLDASLREELLEAGRRAVVAEEALRSCQELLAARSELSDAGKRQVPGDVGGPDADGFLEEVLEADHDDVARRVDAARGALENFLLEEESEASCRRSLTLGVAEQMHCAKMSKALSGFEEGGGGSWMADEGGSAGTRTPRSSTGGTLAASASVASASATSRASTSASARRQERQTPRRSALRNDSGGLVVDPQFKKIAHSFGYTPRRRTPGGRVAVVGKQLGTVYGTGPLPPFRV